MAFTYRFEAIGWSFHILSAPPGVLQTDPTFDVCKQNTSRDVFIRITDSDLSSLKDAMLDDVASLGFGPNDGYVRTRSEFGKVPLITAISVDTSKNFFTYLEKAMDEFLSFGWKERTEFAAKLSGSIRELASQMRNSSSTASGRIEHDMLARLDAWYSTYDEFRDFLRAAARFRSKTDKMGTMTFWYGYEEKIRCLNGIWDYEWVPVDPTRPS